MSKNAAEFFIHCYFKLMTCFDPCSGPSSGHRSICSRKLYSISHKIYHSKIQQVRVVVQYTNAVHSHPEAAVTMVLLTYYSSFLNTYCKY